MAIPDRTMIEPGSAPPYLAVENLTIDYVSRDRRAPLAAIGATSDVEELASELPTSDGSVRAVADVSFAAVDGAMLGIVGEASSGKTTLLQAIVGALPRNAVVVSGAIKVEGRDLGSLSESQLRKMRGTQIGYIPSGGLTHLNPLRRVGKQISDVIRSHEDIGKTEARDRGLELLKRVGIDSPERRYEAYPHELSGGMAQRVAIAMGIACSPKAILADEPTGGLDATVQANILDLLATLVGGKGSTGVIVTRELSIVANYCTHILLLRQGRMIEGGTVTEFFASPQTEYGRRLLELAGAEEEQLEQVRP